MQCAGKTWHVEDMCLAVIVGMSTSNSVFCYRQHFLLATYLVIAICKDHVLSWTLWLMNLTERFNGFGSDSNRDSFCIQRKLMFAKEFSCWFVNLLKLDWFLCSLHYIVNISIEDDLSDIWKYFIKGNVRWLLCLNKKGTGFRVIGWLGRAFGRTSKASLWCLYCFWQNDCGTAIKWQGRLISWQCRGTH